MTSTETGTSGSSRRTSQRNVISANFRDVCGPIEQIPQVPLVSIAIVRMGYDLVKSIVLVERGGK